MSDQKAGTPFHHSLIAGGLAGTTVDLALFPIDTLKTRLQSSQGFFKAGGFRGVYQGMQSVALGSAPGSALFFITYDTMGSHLSKMFGVSSPEAPAWAGSAAHLIAASFGEVAASLVRVPTDNVKVRLQSGMHKTIGEAARDLWNNGAQPKTSTNGVKLGTSFYRGFGITIGRDVPFAMVQFPLYEFLKKTWAKSRTERLLQTNPNMTYDEAYQLSKLSPLYASLCGSVAGGVAAAVSTPLDVARTRLMLGADAQGVAYTNGISTLQRVFSEGVLKNKSLVTGVKDAALVAGDLWTYRKGGLDLMFAGITPRVTWISIGGSVFFGAFETYKYFLESFESKRDSAKHL